MRLRTTPIALLVPLLAACGGASKKPAAEPAPVREPEPEPEPAPTREPEAEPEPGPAAPRPRGSGQKIAATDLIARLMQEREQARGRQGDESGGRTGDGDPDA